EEGIRFTLLSAVQARRIRKLSGGEWQDVSGGKIDPTRAYRVLLPNQRFIDLFFYDGPISHAVAFEKVLGRGEEFVARLQKGFSDGRDWPQLLSVATDGESYGHHFPHGDMALAYTLRQIEMKKSALLTNYGEYLAKSPPVHEVEIYEKSSWSCAHGVARWTEDCGCRIGTQPGWNQAWRAPLRQGLDELKSSLDRFYEEAGGGYFRDPWEARDGYIEVILKRNREVVEAFLARHQKKELATQEKVVALKLLEAQRHALLMFTSCGWFFDDISGVEAVQNLTYAARAIELAREVERSVRQKSETAWEGTLLSHLEQAKSNIPKFKDGAEIYRRKVKPVRVDPRRVVAHCAINALFHLPSQSSVFYTQELRMEEHQSLHTGEATLVTGRVRVISRITFEEEEAVWAAIYLGGGEVCGGLRWRDGKQGYAEVEAQLSDRFLQGSLPEMIREMDRQFGENRFDLSDLLIEERRRVLEEIVHRAYLPIKEVQQRLYTDQRRLMKALVDARMKPPIEFLLAAEYVLNQEIVGLLDRFDEI
ncbi:MAG TPA: DUF3536 domain-containing protein, partial [Nitrospiria bacterium]|nr:DUF3536 domain-containing protein [Nitrospiria bacterium]